MCRHHHRGRLHLRGLVRDGNALGPQGVYHGRVVHQVAEDGERPGVGLIERQGDGVADAKAHAKVCGADDLHDGRVIAISINFTIQSIRCQDI